MAIEPKTLIGREREKDILMEAATSKTSAMIAMIGRRRVGKTYLIRRAMEGRINFEITGKQHAAKQEQLLNFMLTLSRHTNTAMVTQPPKSWLEAFHQLKIYLSQKKAKEKKIIFIDELPWLASPRSGFIESLAHFWNDWASENNVLVLLCGSAAAWMLNNIANNKGGLHNRMQQTIYLQPFTLNEVRQYLKAANIPATNHQIMELYMVIGGIPYYLSVMKKGKSIQQNIDALLFDPMGPLHNEHENLLPSLFDNPAKHNKVINAVSKKWVGLTRKEIALLYDGSDGGTLTQTLDELVQSGFISTYQHFINKSKETIYRLTDPYLLFYKKFIEKKTKGKNAFAQLAQRQDYKAWCGYAFENLCLVHADSIKKRLGIDKIVSQVATYFFKGNKDKEGLQVDMLIDRADGIINLCEMKYYNAPFTIDKKYYTYLQLRKENFKTATKTRKAIHITMVSSLGLQKNNYAAEIVNSEVYGEDFFR